MLLIDVGNSRLKWGIFADAKYVHEGSFVYQLGQVADRLGEALRLIPKQAVWVACVAETVRPEIHDWFIQHWGVVPNYVQAKTNCAGVKNGYAQPEQLGVDRWLAVVAAYEKYRMPVCVVDCGTAVTLDAVDQSGQHLGGLIMPGLNLMYRSLSTGADMLRHILPGQTVIVDLARQTEDAVTAGCVSLLAAGLDGLCTHQRQKLGEKMLIVMTGGDARLIMRHMTQACAYEPDLVLQGLHIAATEKV